MNLLELAIGGADILSGGGPRRWNDVSINPLSDVVITSPAEEPIIEDDAVYGTVTDVEKRWQIMETKPSGILPDHIADFELPEEVEVTDDMETRAGLGAPSDGSIGMVMASGRELSFPIPNIFIRTPNFTNFVDGSFARHCCDEIDTRINVEGVEKDIFTTQNHVTPSYVRNSDCWASGIDLTPISPWNDWVSGGVNRGGILISPDVFICAAHYYIETEVTMRWIAADNTVVDRPIIAGIQIGGTDIYVCRLATPVPNTISFAKVLPEDYAAYLPNVDKRIACLYTDAEEKVCVGELVSLEGTVGIAEPTNVTRLGFYEPLIVGDSGNPICLVVDGTLVALSSFLTEYQGPFLSAYINSINAAMLSMGSIYSLTIADITLFPSYA